MSGVVLEKGAIDNGCIFVGVGLRVMRGDPEQIDSARKSNDERIAQCRKRTNDMALSINKVWSRLIKEHGLKRYLSEMPKDYQHLQVSAIGYGMFPVKINEDIAMNNDFTGKECIYSFSLDGEDSDVEVCLHFKALPSKDVRDIIVNTIRRGRGESSMDMKELKKLDKQAMVKAVANEIKRRFKTFDAGNFNQVDVTVNDKEVHIKYYTNVVFIPLGKTGDDFSYQADVVITDKGFYVTPEADVFFVPTKASKKIVPLYQSPSGDYVRIEEYGDSYGVTVHHKSSEDFTGGAEKYKVNKKTMKAEMVWHEHPMANQGHVVTGPVSERASVPDGYIEQQVELLNSIRSGSMDSDKEVYAFGDPINIYGELTNNSKKTLRINKTFLIHVDLLPSFISLDTGEKLTWLPPPMPHLINEESFFELLPGKKATYSIGRLDSYLTVSQFDGHPASGSYLIQIDYIGKAQDMYTQKKFNGWSGIAKSNAIKVTIK